MFISFDRIHERDGHTDRHTHRHHMSAYAALMHICAAIKNR